MIYIYIYTYEWAINHFPIVMHAQVPTFSDEARAALVPEGEGLDGRREPPSLTQRRAIALQPAACICNKLQICIYIYMHIIYNHIRLIHTCMYACMHTYLHTYVRTCIHTYVHTYMRACMHTDIHTCMHTYILPISGMLKALHV